MAEIKNPFENKTFKVQGMNLTYSFKVEDLIISSNPPYWGKYKVISEGEKLYLKLDPPINNNDFLIAETKNEIELTDRYKENPFVVLIKQ